MGTIFETSEGVRLYYDGQQRKLYSHDADAIIRALIIDAQSVSPVDAYLANGLISDIEKLGGIHKLD